MSYIQRASSDGRGGGDGCGGGASADMACEGKLD